MNSIPTVIYSTTVMLRQYLQGRLPPKLSALGLIALLGAKDMDVAIGSLIKRVHQPATSSLWPYCFKQPHHEFNAWLCPLQHERRNQSS
jgi:hypothetical protein